MGQAKTKAATANNASEEVPTNRQSRRSTDLTAQQKVDKKHLAAIAKLVAKRDDLKAQYQLSQKLSMEDVYGDEEAPAKITESSELRQYLKAIDLDNKTLNIVINKAKSADDKLTEEIALANTRIDQAKIRAKKDRSEFTDHQIKEAVKNSDSSNLNLLVQG